MAENIYINTDKPIDSCIVAGPNQPTMEKRPTALVEGASQSVNLYFIKNDGTFDSRSGSGAVAVKASIGRDGAEPSGGTFTLSDSGGAETEVLRYGCGAKAMEAALNALNSGAGPAMSYAVNFFQTDGVDDKAINADFSYLGEGNYRITGLAKTAGLVPIQVADALDSQTTINTSNEWIEFSATFTGVTMSSVVIGWSDANGFLGNQGSFRQIKILDADTGTALVEFDDDYGSSGSLNGVVYGLGDFIGCTANSGFIPLVTESGLVDVSKSTDGFYTVIWRTNKDREAMTGTSIDLYPESSVTPSVAISGSASQRAQQIIEIKRQPAIYQATWSTITNGFSATLSADNARVSQALAIEKDKPFVLEVSLDGDVVCRTPILIYRQIAV